MPLYLAESDILPQVAGLQSVLIVPCRFCPAASFAVRENKPYIELLRNFLRTEAYESYVQALKRRLEREGIRTAIFDSKLVHQFVACMWTSRRRKALGELAATYDGVVVLGCDATVELVRESVRSDNCRVIQGMDMEGIMNILPRVRWPFDISLELRGVTPVVSSQSRE